MDRTTHRAQVLFAHGATVAVAEEVLAWSRPLDPECLRQLPRLPLAAEFHVETWQEYAQVATQIGVFPALRTRIVQLQFPIVAGMSHQAVYQAATHGLPVDGSNVGLTLEHPEELQLLLHPTPVGNIPVLVARGRPDFVALVQAFAKQNEPVLIPEAMGACLITGYLNWDRVARLRQSWEADHPYPAPLGELYWRQEVREHIAPHRQLYHDSLIILSDGAYSGVGADQLGLSPTAWGHASQRIRLEHECLHYVLHRLLPERLNPLLEELIADMYGMVAAWQNYRATPFLHFVGLEAWPHPRSGARLEIYRGTPPLSDAAFQVLQALLYQAAQNLEQLYNRHPRRWTTTQGCVQLALALAGLSLEELAAPDYPQFVAEALAWLERVPIRRSTTVSLAPGSPVQPSGRIQEEVGR